MLAITTFDERGSHRTIHADITALKAVLAKDGTPFPGEVLVELLSGGRTIASSISMKADVLSWDPARTMLPRPVA